MAVNVQLYTMYTIFLKNPAILSISTVVRSWSIEANGTLGDSIC